MSDPNCASCLFCLRDAHKCVLGKNPCLETKNLQAALMALLCDTYVFAGALTDGGNYTQLLQHLQSEYLRGIRLDTSGLAWKFAKMFVDRVDNANRIARVKVKSPSGRIFTGSVCITRSSSPIFLLRSNVRSRFGRCLTDRDTLVAVRWPGESRYTPVQETDHE